MRKLSFPNEFDCTVVQVQVAYWQTKKHILIRRYVRLSLYKYRIDIMKMRSISYFSGSDTPEYYYQWITFKEIRNHIDCVRKLFNMFSDSFLDTTAIENHLVPIIRTFTQNLPFSPSDHSKHFRPNLGELRWTGTVNFQWGKCAQSAWLDYISLGLKYTSEHWLVTTLAHRYHLYMQ